MVRHVDLGQSMEENNRTVAREKNLEELLHRVKIYNEGWAGAANIINLWNKLSKLISLPPLQNSRSCLSAIPRTVAAAFASLLRPVQYIKIEKFQRLKSIKSDSHRLKKFKQLYKANKIIFTGSHMHTLNKKG